MADLQQFKRRSVHTAQRPVVNPAGRRSSVTMLETTGLVRLMGSDLLTIRVDLD
jgi:hypothetical protein